MGNLIQLLGRIVRGELTGWDAADALDNCDAFHEAGGEILCDEDGTPTQVSVNIPRRIGR